MGNRIRQQKRGKGSPKYIAPSHRYRGKVRYPSKIKCAEVISLVNSVGHQAPLMLIKDDSGKESLLTAPEGIREGQNISFGSEVSLESGNVTSLSRIPPGTPISNLERRPHDGGKIVKTSGSFAHIIEKAGNNVKIKLPSKRIIVLSKDCRATIGRVSGGGRKEKPYLKAGSRHKAMLARGKMHPRTHGVAMNPPDHPHGKTHRRHKGGPTTVKASAPPGQKVGKLSSKKKKKNGKRI